jgi:hypothetical protein
LDGCALANHDLLEAIRALAFVVDGTVRRPVDYKNLGAEELGSVYEALLELRPELNLDAGLFSLTTARGNERKTTGSYYTPTGLVAELIKSAVDPVLDTAARSANPEAAILGLKVCDPASGSGHFLLVAAHRLARRLSQVRTGDAEPAPPALRTALRDVIGHCIYAVDVNPMAVELCKVSLWMEAVEPGKPLNFLDHHIKCGNSLVGAKRDLLANGIPDEAFDPVTGDDKAVARELKRLNKEQRDSTSKHGAYQPLLQTDSTLLAALAADFRDLGRMSQLHPIDVRAMDQRYAQLRHRVAPDKLRADAWCSAFFWPLGQSAYGLAPTFGDLVGLGSTTNHLGHRRVELIGNLAQEHRYFHWHLEFPDVFHGSKDEGFDCVLGNPPWERIKLQEEEFFAQRAPAIAGAPTAAARKKLIAALPKTDPALHAAYVDALHTAEAQSKFFRASKRYPLTAHGDINVYSIFAECGAALLEAHGRVGMVLPWGLAVDDSNKLFFGSMVQQSRLVSAHLYANERKLFADTHHFFRFALFTFGGMAAHISVRGYGRTYIGI